MGWQVSTQWYFGGWVKEKSIKYSLTSPEGHLPGTCKTRSIEETQQLRGILSRVQTCKL
ncbi:hypothetical protein [Nostoc piscinale]|uniref:hypothetical protein n=1 Tax=Nostoc piscinale TaxID=224012 RepID=UPI001F2E18B9|nr:hypothetical protein [Nostoc piscinale]